MSTNPIKTCIPAIAGAGEAAHYPTTDQLHHPLEPPEITSFPLSVGLSVNRINGSIEAASTLGPV